jgi:hypothetical protein
MRCSAQAERSSLAIPQLSLTNSTVEQVIRWNLTSDIPMGVAALPRTNLMRWIELLGTRVAPLVREALAAASAPSQAPATEPLPPTKERNLLRGRWK